VRIAGLGLAGAFSVVGGLGCAGMMGGAAAGDTGAMIGGIVGILCFVLYGVYAVFLMVCFLIAMFKAKAGVYWKYPMTLQLLK